MIDLGPCLRSAATAAFIVAPVARPSSMTITVRPRTITGPRPPRYSLSRRSSSCCSTIVMWSTVPGASLRSRIACLVQHADTASGDGAYGKLLVSRSAQFSHDEYVERHIESPRDFVRDRNTTTRKSEDDHILSPCKAVKLLRQFQARFTAVEKTLHNPPSEFPDIQRARSDSPVVANARASECRSIRGDLVIDAGHSLSLPRGVLSVLALGERADTPAKRYMTVLRFDRDLVGIALCMAPE